MSLFSLLRQIKEVVIPVDISKPKPDVSMKMNISAAGKKNTPSSNPALWPLPPVVKPELISSHIKHLHQGTKQRVK